MFSTTLYISALSEVVPILNCIFCNNVVLHSIKYNANFFDLLSIRVLPLLGPCILMLDFFIIRLWQWIAKDISNMLYNNNPWVAATKLALLWFWWSYFVRCSNHNWQLYNGKNGCLMTESSRVQSQPVVLLKFLRILGQVSVLSKKEKTG